MAALRRNRRDHYLPQSYLKGFVDPTRRSLGQPLSQFDVRNRVWSERSPREIGYRYGFYDYATANAPLETADSAFAELEQRYPLILQDLAINNFANWGEHRDFLLRYVQMIRARSLLFFEQKREEGRRLQTWAIEEVSLDRKSVKLRSMTPESPPPDFIRNWTITEMRAEIKKGAAWLDDFNWTLRYCESIADPFIINEMPVVASGPEQSAEKGMRHPDTLLFFPLCWEACLIGSRQFFETEIGCFGQADMSRTRKIYCETASLFLASPTRLDF